MKRAIKNLKNIISSGEFTHNAEHITPIDIYHVYTNKKTGEKIVFDHNTYLEATINEKRKTTT